MSSFSTRIIAVCLGCWFISSHAAAQNPFSDSPFGGADNPFGAVDPGMDDDAPFADFGAPTEPLPGAVVTEPSANTSAAGSLDEEEKDPVVRILREEPPRTPEDMGRGLTWMVRLKRWDEVRRLLDMLAAADWSLEQKAQLAEAAGPALWLRLSGVEANLDEAHLQLIAAVASAPAALARQPVWLDKWIAKLASEHPGERRLAQLRLQDGGQAAVERLMNQLLEGESKIAPQMLAGTVVQFGEVGKEALRAGCLVGAADRAARVYLALAELPGNEFSAELGAGLYSVRLSAADKAELAARLSQRYSTLPEPIAIHAYLATKFQDHLDLYQEARLAGEQDTRWAWRPTADGKAIMPVEVSRREQALEAVARLAAHRLNFSVATTDDLVDSGVVVLQRAYHVHPGLTPGELRPYLIADWDQTIAQEADYWIQVFERASELQMHGAAVRALDMLAETAQGNYLLPLDFLSELLGDSRPLVRYMALTAINQLDPKRGFVGAEKALEVAVEMTQLGSGPHALVVGLHAVLRQAAGQQLQMLTAAEISFANSARAALAVLDSTTPVEIVVIVDRVADQSLYEFLQRLRSSERGQALPIAVLTDELYQHERMWIAEAGGVVSSILSRNPDHLRRVMERVMGTLDTQPLETSDRNYFGSVAAQFLSRLTADRDTYAFYPIADWRDELELLGGELETATQLKLLAGLGSAESQRQLAQLAGDARLTAEQRLAAATAFGHSVKRFGMLLARSDILEIYNLYNTLGPKDPAMATSLGLALDVAEAQAGKQPWPEGL